jgi:hypothetical protein
VQQLSGTLSGRIRAGLVVYIMAKMSASKYFVQKSLEEKFLQKEKMIFILKVSPGKNPKYQIRVVLCQPKKISSISQHPTCGENECSSKLIA